MKFNVDIFIRSRIMFCYWKKKMVGQAEKEEFKGMCLWNIFVSFDNEVPLSPLEVWQNILRTISTSRYFRTPNMTFLLKFSLTRSFCKHFHIALVERSNIIISDKWIYRRCKNLMRSLCCNWHRAGYPTACNDQ